MKRIVFSLMVGLLATPVISWAQPQPVETTVTEPTVIKVQPEAIRARRARAAQNDEALKQRRRQQLDDFITKHPDLSPEDIRQMKALHEQYPDLNRGQLFRAVKNPGKFREWLEKRKERRENLSQDRREDVRDRREDIADRREDVRDRREDVADRREDRIDRQTDTGRRDRLEDIRDRREDIRDRREDVVDQREDVRDRREDVRDNLNRAPQRPSAQPRLNANANRTGGMGTRSSGRSGGGRGGRGR
ncbi:MAG: hypothetical protein Q7S13_04685 [Candidatus Omnitrophota bacterium]|nr:hypothetical protein [Candidatus Omnitrophota bacterium]